LVNYVSKHQTAEEQALAAPASDESTSHRTRLRKPLIVVAAATLGLLTVGGGTAAAMQKDVSIVVDGQARQISTTSDSVGGALVAAGLNPTSHDVVAPAVNEPVSDGTKIVLDRGRLLTLTIDGQPKKIWTTARTLDQALAQLGPAASKLSISANRSRPIPVDGLSVQTATLHTVALSVAGAAKVSSTTPATTVGSLLAEKKVKLGARDTVTPAVATHVTDGLLVKVTRVTISNTVRTVVVAKPPARTIDDSHLSRGTSKVVQRGKAGKVQIHYTVTRVNGHVTRKAETSRKTVVAAVPTITRVGTKSSFTYVGNEVFTNDTSFGVNWDGLANCESTHNPRAVNANPSAGLPTYGLFQFDIPTWATVGGSGNPMDASPEEQLMRAKLLFQQRGLEPWACRDAAH